MNSKNFYTSKKKYNSTKEIQKIVDIIWQKQEIIFGLFH